MELETSERKYVQDKKIAKDTASTAFFPSQQAARLCLPAGSRPHDTFRQPLFQRTLRSTERISNAMRFSGTGKPHAPNAGHSRSFETKEPQRWEWNCPLTACPMKFSTILTWILTAVFLVLELGLDISERKQVGERPPLTAD